MQTRLAPLRLAVALVVAEAGAVAAAPQMDQPLVPDVRAAFARIAEAGHRLGAWSEGQLPYPSYSLNSDHDIGDNHFQGVQRLRAGPYLVVSGSNIGRAGDPSRAGPFARATWGQLLPPQGDLIVIRLGGARTSGPLGPNINAAGQPADAAQVVARVPIDRLAANCSGTTAGESSGPRPGSS